MLQLLLVLVKFINKKFVFKHFHLYFISRTKIASSIEVLVFSFVFVNYNNLVPHSHTHTASYECFPHNV